ncbi:MULTISPECIES: hypothetical protein [unclassified Campylobacter]|uniref:hypothetical protein n=1 Tax=unclassified Campylobacter TaxID=2593542 RepID=UPI0022E9B621|nr:MULTISPECIES: hypothetical protein [unclassified Campylobacter]MDA3056613.1 hypothetical protein [Campylobacter sp. CN_NA1]MDA3065708.1 hypothetical protein [Campylobacter sp. CN_NE4]MDA3069025.1 hypothetical protein [Campylobacter sp. CN_NE3]MDA3083161.1 hypothetical protein [Campylobacter sp. CN_EL2]MDA3084665.1 hypothetical protein [Campylobacter sp. CN_NE1]
MQKISKARFLEFWKNIFLGNILPLIILFLIVENEPNVKAFTIVFWTIGSVFIYMIGAITTRKSDNNFFKDNLKFIAGFWISLCMIWISFAIIHIFVSKIFA